MTLAFIILTIFGVSLIVIYSIFEAILDKISEDNNRGFSLEYQAKIAQIQARLD